MSSSSSSTVEETKYNDNRKVFGANGIDASNGGFVSITDGGAISMAGRALDSSLMFADDFGTKSLNFAGDVVGSAFAFGTKTVNASLDASSEATNNALAFATRANIEAANRASDALAFAQSSSAQSALAQREALDTAAGSLSQSLAYGAKSTAVALDSLNNTAGLVKDAYADAKGRGALTDKIMMVAIAGAMFVAFKASSR